MQHVPMGGGHTVQLGAYNVVEGLGSTAWTVFQLIRTIIYLCEWLSSGCNWYSYINDKTILASYLSFLTYKRNCYRLWFFLYNLGIKLPVCAASSQ